MVALGWLGLACAVPISSGLEENDANRVIVALENGGVVAQKEPDPAMEGRLRVTVGRDDASTAVTILQQENLPPRSAPGVLQSLGDGSLVPSRTAEHAKLIAGTAGELEQSLRAVEGVLSSRVHLAVANRGPLGEDQPSPPGASGLVRHRGATPPLSPAQVQRLVAGAVVGLEDKRVNVVMTSVPEPPRTPERDLSRFGPITVTRGSLMPLRVLVAVAVLLNVVLVGLLGLLWARMRRAQSGLEALRLASDEASRERR